MKRLFLNTVLIFFLLFSSGVFAQEETEIPAESPGEIPAPEMPVFSFSGELIPGNIRNNQYYMESMHYAEMAQAAFDEGEYDASIRYSQEAIRFAGLSDEFVAFMLLIKEADDAILAAEERFTWASSEEVNAGANYPEEYERAGLSLDSARNSREEESWENAIWFAYDVIDALYDVSESGRRSALPLPAQYTVREWASSWDCLWNIAERYWAYGDPEKWIILYDANRSKFPDPEDPNVLEPGMILDIPVIDGEIRQGMWRADGVYGTF